MAAKASRLAGVPQAAVDGRRCAASSLAPPARELPVPFAAAAAPASRAGAGGERPLLAPQGDHCPVTIMMRNIPSRCGLTSVLEVVETSGFRGTFEFLYLPTKPPGHSQNRGYAFVSFLDMEQARAFWAAISGARFVDRASPKEVQLEEAREYRSLRDVCTLTRTQIQVTKFGPVLVVVQQGDGRHRESDPEHLTEDDELPYGTRLYL